MRLLLKHGADLQRDDAQEQWFTPVHNAVANGAHALVREMLDAMPEAINLTTGDGRSPLHVLVLCDDAADREATCDVLLRRRPALDFQEPFRGDSPLHAAARDGASEVVIKLLEAGASPGTTNEAGRTALEEAQFELSELQREGASNQNAAQEGNIARRLSRLQNTLQVMEIAMLAY